jgi:hypothetical protein
MEWFRVEPQDGIGPVARWFASVVMDPIRHRVIVFGGENGGYPLDEVWALDLVGPPAWTQLTPAGPSPGGHRGSAAIYDPVKDRVLVFGGDNGSVYLQDVWALSLSGNPTWSMLNPAGTPPDPRGFPSATYDPIRKRMIVFGGLAAGGEPRNDVWALDLTGGGTLETWIPLAAGGTPPAARYAHLAVYDRDDDRVVVFGGQSSSEVLGDVWALSLAGTPAWSRITPAGPAVAGRYAHAGAYDARRDCLVSVGGYLADGLITAEVLTLSLGSNPTWTVRPSPGWLVHHTMTVDPERDRAIVFGGETALGRTNAVWALGLARPVPWTPLAPTGTPPAPRRNHSAVCDSAGDRLIVFGGAGEFGDFADLWSLSLTGAPAWTPIAAGGGPPAARSGHSAILDPVRRRMIVFGGSADGILKADVWALSLSGAPAWSVLTPGGTPPFPRADHVAIYDPVGDRMIVHGGLSTLGPMDDAWALNLSGTPTWTSLGSSPIAREQHVAVLDAARARMVVVGGIYAGAEDPWSMALSGAPVWTRLVPAGPAPLGCQARDAIVDPARDRMILFGGNILSEELWSLAWSPGETDVAPLPAAPSLVLNWAPNPAGERTWLAIASPIAGRATLRIADLSGRLVRAIDLGQPTPGSHRVEWDGRDAAGARVPSGVYFTELRVADRVIRGRVALVR